MERQVKVANRIETKKKKEKKLEKEFNIKTERRELVIIIIITD